MATLMHTPTALLLLTLSATVAAQETPAIAPEAAETAEAASAEVASPTASPALTPTGAAPDVSGPAAAPATEAAATSDALGPSEDEIRQQEESFRDSREDEARDNRKGIAVAARISTLGVGVEAVKSVHKRINLRAQGNFFSYSDTLNEDDIDYDGKLKLQTIGALVDLHPFAGGARLSAGLYSNANQVKLNASCKTECEVGDFTVSSEPGDNPQLRGAIDFKSVAPYVGIGYGNAMRGFPLHFAFDVGVLLQGSPKVSLDASGTATVTDNETGVTTRRNLATDTEFQDQLADEERNAEDSSKEFKYYPVLSFTLGYRFNLF